jgi:hypothetical protein
LNSCRLKMQRCQSELRLVTPVREHLRIYIIESSKVLEHAIAKIHVIPRLAPKESELLRLHDDHVRFQVLKRLPCQPPIVPGRGRAVS